MRLEGEVLDRQPTTEPLTFIVRLYTEYLILEGAIIEIIGINEDLLMIELHECSGICIEEGAVRLEVYAPPRTKHFQVTLEEASAGETLGHLLHLWIGKGDPDLIDFARGEKVGQGLNLPSEEGDICHSCLVGELSSRPDTSPLDVHPDEVLIGIELS
jgi:hypothetical protein